MKERIWWGKKQETRGKQKRQPTKKKKTKKRRRRVENTDVHTPLAFFTKYCGYSVVPVDFSPVAHNNGRPRKKRGRRKTMGTVEWCRVPAG
jgi:hypothetical protein